MEHVIAQARTVLEATPARWETLTRTLPADLLTRQPDPGEWSALECLQHLVDTESIFRFRIQCILEGKDFPRFDPDSEGTKPDASQSPTDLAAEFTRLRAEGLKALEGVQPSDLERTARHQELGIVSMSQLVHEWAAHDLNHTVQAERALMQPFIEGCGPWQSYFADHMRKSR